MVALGFFLIGALCGVLIKRRRPDGDERYQAARRVVAQHFGTHATLNLAQFERLMDETSRTAMHYLEQLQRDGVIRQHRHTARGAFYTRP